MIVTTNIFLLPFVLIIWVIDSWVVLLSAKLVLQNVRTAWAGRACTAIAPFTDGLLTPATRWVQRRWPRISVAAIGFAVLLFCVILRQLIVRIIVGLA